LAAELAGKRGVARRRFLKNMARFLRRQPIGAASAVILVLLVVVAVFANVVSPYSPTVNNTGPALSGPTLNNPFGTDNFGRDVLSRVIHGARTSLYVGLGATLTAAVVGTLIGAISGYAGGPLDYFVQRLVDAAQAVPPLILLIGIMIVLEPSTTNVIIALAVRGSLTLSRVIRGSVLSIRTLPYVEAARSVGASHVRIVLGHVIPNLLPTILVLTSVSIGGNIVAEASLSFLGYGIPPPNPTWGGMMSAEGRLYMLLDPWILVFPTLALALVVYSMNMLGDAIRDEFDPRLRTTR
jgi:peptide/nickel transport system permease protein